MNSLGVILSVGAVCLLMLSCSDAGSLGQPASPHLAHSTPQPETYFGVNAADKEAVQAKQKELSMEQWERIMGNSVDIEQLDFSPALSNDGFFSGILKRITSPFTTKSNKSSPDNKQ